MKERKRKSFNHFDLNMRITKNKITEEINQNIEGNDNKLKIIRMLIVSFFLSSNSRDVVVVRTKERYEAVI